ncbi:MAG TPA: RDD family protein [bacterium]|nr:RDD family protein [bacterium]
MTIGKYCQLCGERKKKNEVIAEAHGVVVTAPCLMNKVFADPPEKPEAVRAMARYCAVCGARQPAPLPDHCGACGSVLTPEAAARDLAAAGETARLIPRLAAFLIDLAVIAALIVLAVHAINLIAPAAPSPGLAAPGQEVEGASVYTLLKYVSALLIFIFYHAAFASLLGATPGKKALGLRVVLKNGAPRVDFMRALVRGALYPFTIYVVPIGFLPLIFQEPPSRWLELIEQDAMFHNSLTDTTVVKI